MSSRVVLRLGAVLAIFAAGGIAAGLMQAGASTGVAVVTGTLLVGVVLAFTGRALTGYYRESRLSIMGFVVLFFAALSIVNLGRELWPHVEPMVLLAGGVAAIVVVLVVGGRAVDAIVRQLTARDRARADRAPGAPAVNPRPPA